jgi:hypothetical protein
LNRTTLTLAVILASQTALAGQFDYQCEILGEAFVNNDGTIRLVSKSSLVGKHFAVDRKTGAVVGGNIFHWGDLPHLLAYGSNENSFQVYWVAKAGGADGVHFDHLTVESLLNRNASHSRTLTVVIWLLDYAIEARSCEWVVSGTKAEASAGHPSLETVGKVHRAKD